MLRLVCLQWDFMPGVRDDVSHVEVNVKWFCCGEDMLNLIMNWYSWPRIKTLLDVFLFSKDFTHTQCFFSLFNNKPWWRILLSFTEVEQGWNLIYWPLCVAWVLRFPKCFEGMGPGSPKKTWCLCVQVRFISFFQGLIFLVKHVIEFITMLRLLQIWSTWTRWTWTCSVQLRSLSDQIENHQFTFLKVKMEVENQLIEFQQDNHLANLHFLGFMVILRECTCYPWPFLLKWWIVQWKLTLGQKHKTDD